MNIVERGSGGEAVVFETSLEGSFAKIYRADRLARGVDALEEKVAAVEQQAKRMKRSAQERVALPLQCLYDAAGRFVGFTMTAFVDADSLRDIIPGLKRIHDDWGAKERLDIALQLAWLYVQVQKAGFLIGDPSANNVMVMVGEEERPRVALIDADSFHLPQHPCVVKTPPYVRPSLLRQSAGWGETTAASDAHGLAVLVFQALVGASPYHCKGGGSPSENVKKGCFPYDRPNTFGAMFRHLPEPPDQRFSERWKHLPTDDLRLLLTQALDHERVVAPATLFGALHRASQHMPAVRTKRRLVFPFQKSIA